MPHMPEPQSGQLCPTSMAGDLQRSANWRLGSLKSSCAEQLWLLPRERGLAAAPTAVSCARHCASRFSAEHPQVAHRRWTPQHASSTSSPLRLLNRHRISSVWTFAVAASCSECNRLHSSRHCDDALSAVAETWLIVTASRLQAATDDQGCGPGRHSARPCVSIPGLAWLFLADDLELGSQFCTASCAWGKEPVPNFLP